MCKTQNFDEWIDHWFVDFIGYRNGCRYIWKNSREVDFKVFADNFLCAHTELSDSENFIVEITIMNTIIIMDLLNISIRNTAIPKLNMDFSTITVLTCIFIPFQIIFVGQACMHFMQIHYSDGRAVCYHVNE